MTACTDTTKEVADIHASYRKRDYKGVSSVCFHLLHLLAPGLGLSACTAAYVSHSWHASPFNCLRVCVCDALGSCMLQLPVQTVH
jgi:hypothetical protein